MSETKECNGTCLSASDIGVGEYGDMIAYAHPDCPVHGDPLEDGENAETCGGGDESLRYVREEDIVGRDNIRHPELREFLAGLDSDTGDAT